MTGRAKDIAHQTTRAPSYAAAISQIEEATKGMGRDDLLHIIAELSVLGGGRREAFIEAFPPAVGLSRLEAALVASLHRRPGMAFTLAQLAMLVFLDEDASEDALYSLIKRARRKLRATEWRLKNRHGVGYYMERKNG